MTGRFFWFSYHAALHYGRLTAPHQVRDGAAFAEIAGLLSEFDMRYGGLILNLPSSDKGNPISYEKLRLTPNDLLVLTTRPPLDDENEDDKKRVARSGSILEDRVIKLLRPFLSICSRSRIALSREVLDRFNDRAALRPTRMHFRQNKWSWCYEIKHYKEPKENWKESAPRTFAFMLSTHAHRGNPKIFAAFGMGGTETLLWTRWLRTKGSKFVRSALQAKGGAIVLAQLAPAECLPPEPCAEALSAKWTVEVLANAFW